MSAPFTPEGQEPAERFLRFTQREDASSVALRYQEWPRTPLGGAVMNDLALLAQMRTEALLTKARYEDALCELALKTGVPLADLRIMAEGKYEARRSYVLSTGLLSSVAGDWNNGGGR